MQRGLQFFSSRQRFLSVFKNGPPSASQFDATRKTTQQLDAPTLLEFPHLSGKRRLREVQRFRCTGQASELCGGVKQQELVEVHIQSHRPQSMAGIERKYRSTPLRPQYQDHD